MRTRLLTDGIELWNWYASNLYNPCHISLFDFMFEIAVPGKPLFKFSSDPLYNIHVLLIVNVECMHIFNFEQHGQLAIVNFAQAYKSDKKDYLKMTRPISTLYGCWATLMIYFQGKVVFVKLSGCAVVPMIKVPGFDLTTWFNEMLMEHFWVLKRLKYRMPLRLILQHN